MAAAPAAAAFTALERQLRSIRRDAEKDLTRELRQVGHSVRDEVRGSTDDPYRTGKLRRSVKTSVRKKSTVSLYSNEPQAPVFEFGGKIEPRGTTIEIPRTEFVGSTVDALGRDIDERMADAFDSISRRHGFT